MIVDVIVVNSVMGLRARRGENQRMGLLPTDEEP
jgi:hypothetical protein